MDTNNPDFKEYVKKALELYRHTPGTMGRVRQQDRRLAGELYHRGVALGTLEEALTLAAARRCFRPPDALPLSPIRSFHYFVPVIEELLANPLPADYFKYLKQKLAKIRKVPGKMLLGAPGPISEPP
jgi:hypothetical protein